MSIKIDPFISIISYLSFKINQNKLDAMIEMYNSKVMMELCSFLKKRGMSEKGAWQLFEKCRDTWERTCESQTCCTMQKIVTNAFFGPG